MPFRVRLTKRRGQLDVTAVNQLTFIATVSQVSWLQWHLNRKYIDRGRRQQYTLLEIRYFLVKNAIYIIMCLKYLFNACVGLYKSNSFNLQGQKYQLGDIFILRNSKINFCYTFCCSISKILLIISVFKMWLERFIQLL